MRLSILALKNPQIIKNHSLEILTLDPDKFCFTDEYVARPLRHHITSKKLEPDFLKILLTFPQFHPLLAENAELDTGTYDELLEPNNTLTYSAFLRAGECWRGRFTEEQMYKILKKYANEKIFNLKYTHFTVPTHDFKRRVQIIPYIKMLWYILRNIDMPDYNFYDEITDNPIATLPLQVTVLEKCISEKSRSIEYVFQNIIERFPKKITQILKDQLPNLLDDNYKPAIMSIHEYVKENKLEETKVKEEVKDE